ncbi:hypothetical protein G9A89_005068 [Geosiphon pyriformis]|nr:hypothetical protein G9A89_005068 [Geosiphon pyriformis]
MSTPLNNKAAVEAFLQAAANFLSTNHSNHFHNSDGVNDKLNVVLDELLTTNVVTFTNNEKDVLDLLVTACKAINPGNEQLASKGSKLLFNFSNKNQFINIYSSRNSPLELFISFLINAYSNTTQLSYKLDILRALSKVLFENGGNCQKYHVQLLQILLPLAHPNNLELSSRRMAINCLGNLCVKTGNKLQGKYQNIYDICLGNLNAGIREGDENSSLKVLSSTLRALQFVVTEDKNILAEPFGATIETIKNYVFFNVGSKNWFIDRTNITRLPINSYNKSSVPWHHEKANIHSSHSWMSSDSEFSDGDYNQTRKNNDDSRIRLNALGCLQSMIRASPKLLYPYWNKFLPDARPLSSMSPSLFTLIAHDPILTVRIAACSCITTLIDGSKQFLTVANDREIKSSFTSLSANVGAIVRELHSELIEALTDEHSSALLIQLLKCSTALINNSAYERLSSGYLSRFYHAVLVLISHKETPIRIAVLGLLSAIVDCRARYEEIALLLQEQIINLTNFDKQSSNEIPAPVNLLIYLIKLIGNTMEPSSLRIAGWGLLCVCARMHLSILCPLWPQLNILITSDLKNDDVNIRTASMKFLEEYAKSAAAPEFEDQNSFEDEAIIVHPEEKLLMPGLLKWWTDTLDNHIQMSSFDTCHAVRALTCDSLYHMPYAIFSQLPPERALYSVTLLLRFGSDESPNVRASACRALGGFILFPHLQEDTNFATDMAFSVIQNMSDVNLLVRLRSSWALGNLCDALVLISLRNSAQLNSGTILDFLTDHMWIKIVKAGLAGSNDNDKIRPNAVRTLGSLMRISPREFLTKEQTGLVKDVVMTLIKNFEHGSLKIRWNACYAAANMLRNQDFPIGFNHWTSPLYDSLTKAVRSAKNFKVRINACLALSIPTKRENFGDMKMFCKIFEAIVLALENVDSMGESSFQEFKYQEQLRLQLLETYQHLVLLATPQDQLYIQSFVQRASICSAFNKDKIVVMTQDSVFDAQVP